MNSPRTGRRPCSAPGSLCCHSACPPQVGKNICWTSKGRDFLKGRLSIWSAVSAPFFTLPNEVNIYGTPLVAQWLPCSYRDVKTRSLFSASWAGDEDCPASQLCFPGEVLTEVMVGSCESTEEGSKLTLVSQGKVSSEMISEPCHGGGGGVDRGTSREAEFWAESTACAKARGQETASYISVWELLAVWSSWSMEQSARDQLGQPCRNGWGRFPQFKMPASLAFLWVGDQCNCFPQRGKNRIPQIVLVNECLLVF